MDEAALASLKRLIETTYACTATHTGTRRVRVNFSDLPLSSRLFEGARTVEIEGHWTGDVARFVLSDCEQSTVAYGFRTSGDDQEGPLEVVLAQEPIATPDEAVRSWLQTRLGGGSAGPDDD